MTLANRIQEQRKLKGISQEELADKIGVSRQAVSKWESEQCMPDLDKIIILSDYFGVTTDYLIKGTETCNNNKSLPEEEVLFTTNIFYITGIASNVLGFVSTLIIWLTWQNYFAFLVGTIFMIYSFFAMFFAENINRFLIKKQPSLLKIKKYKYIMLNNWIWLFFPIVILFNTVCSIFNIITNLGVRNMICGIIYIIICSFVTYFCFRKINNEK